MTNDNLRAILYSKNLVWEISYNQIVGNPVPE